MKKLLCFLFILFLLPGALGQYISGDIYIDDSGFVEFDVNADKEIQLEGLNFENNKIMGTTELLTKKEGGSWTFFLHLDGEYETIFLEIHLPKNLKLIEDVEGVSSIIDIDEKIVTIVDYDRKLDFEITYQIKPGRDYTSIIGIITVLLLLYLLYSFKKKKKKKGDDRLEHIMPLINDNEKKIIEALMKRTYRQKELRKILEIPKASYSRYVHNLEKKKLIVRIGEGKNKILKLK